MKVVPVCCLCLAENFRNVSYLKIQFNGNFVVLLKEVDITISFKASEKFYSTVEYELGEECGHKLTVSGKKIQENQKDLFFLNIKILKVKSLQF